MVCVVVVVLLIEMNGVILLSLCRQRRRCVVHLGRRLRSTKQDQRSLRGAPRAPSRDLRRANVVTAH